MIFREINISGIVAHDGDKLITRNLNIFETDFNPQHLSTEGCCSYIFIFNYRKRNGSVFLVDLVD
jgi:hypothetical protein